MPIYEFVCGKCDEDFEVLCRSETERRRQKCPSCGSGKVTKKFSVFATRSASADSGRTRSTSSCSACSRSTCASCTR